MLDLPVDFSWCVPFMRSRPWRDSQDLREPLHALRSRIMLRDLAVGSSSGVKFWRVHAEMEERRVYSVPNAECRDLAEALGLAVGLRIYLSDRY